MSNYLSIRRFGLAASTRAIKMKSFSFLFWTCGAIGLIPNANAEALIKPLPQPNTAGMPVEAQTLIKEIRAQFEQQKPSLVGTKLAVAYGELGVSYARFKQYDIAQIAFDNSLALVPVDARMHYLKGMTSMLSGDFRAAIPNFETTIKYAKDYAPTRFRLADALLQTGDYVRAEQILNDVIKTEPNSAPAYAGLAELALKRKQWKIAITQAQKTLQLDPTAKKLNGIIAQAYLALGDKPKADAANAIANLVDVRIDDPLFENITGRIQVAVPKPMQLLLAKKFTEARLASEAAIKAAPSSAQTMVVHGMVLEANKMDAEAAKAYQSGRTLDPKNLDALSLHANLALRLKQYSLASNALRSLSQLQPTDSSVHGRLLAADSLAGQCALSLQSLSLAQEKSPLDAALAQYFARAAGSCARASNADLVRAKKLASALYAQQPNEEHAETLALVSAASNDFIAATDYQAQAIFEALKRNDQNAAAQHKSWMADFTAKRRPTKPWPDNDPWITPTRFSAQ